MTPRPWRVPMLPRTPNEAGRTATPLELFFDVVFVVAFVPSPPSSTTASWIGILARPACTGRPVLVGSRRASPLLEVG